MASLLNGAFMKLSKRAEMNDPAKLVATFVDIGPLLTLLSNIDHQVLYGRRGTGKTHALTYLGEVKRKDGHVTVYLDMRTVGSTGGLYADTTIPTAQRATRLLVDTLNAIHDELLSFCISNAELYDLSKTGIILDRVADAITGVYVAGNVEVESIDAASHESNQSTAPEISIGTNDLKIALRATDDIKNQRQISQRTKETGVIEQRVHFGSLGRDFAELCKLIPGKRVWILLDEWSSVPLDLQPYLADLLRRSVFPVTNFSVKIAAIEQRSRFRISTRDRDYIGMELGADIAADLNLDDFTVFDVDPQRATEFFQELLYKHYLETDEVDRRAGPRSSTELVQQAFTQKSVFDEFVRAAEGVPRDAINILTLSAQRALEDKISVTHIRTSARNWYQRDKEASARADNDAYALLHWIIDQVIGERRSRAFLLRNDSIPELVTSLFDARVLHVLKKNISARDQPGIRYDSYKLDYGCYVDLISTTKSPLGLFKGVDENNQDLFIDIPPDDYRAIRRAILDINEFYQKRNGSDQLNFFS